MVKQIKQNGQRYSRKGNSWIIQAVESGIKPEPIEFLANDLQTDLYPLLTEAGNGILVAFKAISGQTYLLCSPDTKTAIIDSKTTNPHYNSNGVNVGNVIIGDSIPLIEIDGTKLVDIANSETEQLKKAGIGFIEFIFNGAEIENTNGDLTERIVKQINYTLDKEVSRSCTLWKKYNINSLFENYDAYRTEVIEVNKKYSDKELFTNEDLKNYLTEIGDIRAKVQEDVNTIKQLFVYGNTDNPNQTSEAVESDCINIATSSNVSEYTSTLTKKYGSTTVLSAENNLPSETNVQSTIPTN